MDHETLSEWDRQPEADIQASKRGHPTAEPQSHQSAGGKSQPGPEIDIQASKPGHPATAPQVLTPESTSPPRSQESGSRVGEMMTVELKVEGGSGSATASVKIALPPSVLAVIGRSANRFPSPNPM
jgi:hypothetical protein